MSLRKQLARLLFSAMGIPTEGQLLGFDNAAQLPAWVDPPESGGGGGTTVIRTTSQVVAASTTANDSVLSVAVTPNKRYRVQGYVVTNEPSATNMRAAIHGGAHDGGEDLYPTGMIVINDGGIASKLVEESGQFGSVSNTSYCELIGTKGLHFDVCVFVGSETTLRMVYYNGSESTGYSITQGVMTVTQLD